MADATNVNPKLETPLTIRQVESHLIFGPISRHLPFAYVAFVFVIIALIASFLATNLPVGQYIGRIADKLIFVFIPLLLLKMTWRQQAIVGWIAVKLTMGIVAFMMITVGAAVSFQRGQADAWPNLFLGLIWLPGPEFIQKVTPYQKYVTLARLLLSAPCIYFGVRSGNWHW